MRPPWLVGWLLLLVHWSTSGGQATVTEAIERRLQAVDAALVSDFRFEAGDITGTSLKNYATGGSAATLVGSPSLGSGSPSNQGGSYLALTTIAKYVTLPSLTLAGTDAFTFTAWLQIPSALWPGTFRGIASFLTDTSWSSGVIISVSSQSAIYVTLDGSNGGAASSYSIADKISSSSWFHIAVVMGNVPHPLLYINGVLVYTYLDGPKTTPRTYTCYFGYTPWTGGSENYLGNVDDIRIYTRQLDASEIVALTALPVPSAVPSAVPTTPTAIPTPSPTFTPTTASPTTASPTTNADASVVWDFRFEAGDITGTSLKNYATDGSAATLVGSPSLASASPSVYGRSDVVLNTGAKYATLPSVTISGTAYTFAAWLQIPAATRGTAAMPIANFLTTTSPSSGPVIHVQPPGGTKSNNLYIYGDFDGLANGAGLYGYSLDSYIASNSWFHVAVVLGNVPAPQLYINGVLVYTWTYTGLTAPTTTRTYTNCRVGYTPWGPTSEMFFGSVDDIRLYTRQLAASEIAALAALPVPSAVPTLAPSSIPTAVPSLLPTPVPSVVPMPTTLPSTAQPTVQPTHNPSRMTPTGGPYFYHTYHSGAECASTATHYTVNSFLLGQCNPPDELNPTPYKLSCKASISGYIISVFKSTYAAGDTSCAGSSLSPSVLVAHPFTCEKQPQRDAGYLLSACGDIPSSIKARPQVLVKGYAQPGGTPKPKSLPRPLLCYGPAVVTRAYVLKSCMAYKRDGSRLSYYRKFSLLSKTAGSIVLKESRYLETDNRCLQAPYTTVNVTYGATASCSADPLDSSMAYIQAIYYNGNVAANWAAADLFIRSPLVPTASPTPRPSVPTAFPTFAAPSPLPSLVPSANPSPRPSLVPSAVPSPAPTIYLVTTRGLVLHLDAAKYSGRGPWIDFQGKSAFTLVNRPTWSSSGGGSFAFDPSRTQYALRSTSLPTMARWTVEAWMTYSLTETGSLPMVVTDLFPPQQQAVINFALGSPRAGSASLDVGFLTTSAWYLAAPFNAQSAAMIPFTGWSHVVGSFDGSTLKLFLNNVLVLSKAAEGSPVSGGGGIKLMQSWNRTDCMGGSLAVVRIYSVALTAYEIDQNFRADSFSRFSLYTANVPTPAPTSAPTAPSAKPSAAPTTSFAPTLFSTAAPPTPSAAPTTAPSRVPVVTRGLVLALDAATFVPGATTWVDSVGSRAFTLYNSPVWSSAGGGSLAFVPASSQYAQGPAMSSMSTWTIEVWHLPSGLYTGDEPCLVSDIFNGGSVNFALGSIESSFPNFRMGWYSIDWRKSTAITLTTGVWQHIVASFDGTTGNLYVNNVLKATANMAGTPVSGNVGIRLMRRWDAGDYWGGSIALVRIYNVGLTPAEVNTNWLFDSERFGYSAAPTAAPTYLPSSSPTYLANAPTPPPSPAPTKLPAVTRGLVLALDAATFVPGATTWVDSVGGRAFTLYNGPTWSSAGGGSLAFVPASSQYAQSTTALPSMSTWTIEVWHQWSGQFIGTAAIVTDIWDRNNINFALGSPDNQPSIVGGWWNLNAAWHMTPGTTLATGAWLHIVASFDGTTGNVYVNNVLKATANIAGTPSSGNVGIRLMRVWDVDYYWGGALSKVNIYSVGLSAAEVQNNWQLDSATRFGYAAPPTSPPTTYPSAAPSYLPGFPTPAPFVRRATRGLVLALDAASFVSGSNTWVDSVTGRVFQLYNGPTWSATVGGGSFTFVPARGQYAQSTTALPPLSTWTVEVWTFYSGAYVGAFPCIVADVAAASAGPNFVLGSASTSYPLSTGFAGESSAWRASAPTTLAANNWLHLVASYDGSALRVYVNSALAVSTAATGTPTSGATGIRLMQRWTGTTDLWGGSLSVVRIYNAALTETEIHFNWLMDKARFSYTPAPTAAPSYLPGAPTPLPSAAPTMPSAAPTPVPSRVPVVTRGLVLALDAATFVPGATTWVDSVGGLSFTLYNSPVWSSAGGGSLAFVPASSQYAQSPPLPTLSAWTIEVWHLPSGLNTGPEACIVTDIYGANAYINFALGSTDSSAPNLRMGWHGEGFWRQTIGFTIPTGVWQHIVASSDGTTGNLYVNNVLKATATMVGTPVSGNLGIRLMRRFSDYSSDYWGGSLGKVNIYNVGFTAAEVTTNWLADAPRFGYTAAPTVAPSAVPSAVPSAAPSSPPPVPVDATLWLDAQVSSSMTFTSGLVTSWTSLVGSLVLTRAYPGGGGPVLTNCFNDLPGVNFAASGGGFATQPVAISSTGDATVVFVGTLSIMANAWAALFAHGDSNNDLSLEWNSNSPTTVHFQTNNDNLGNRVSFLADAPYIYICTLSGGAARTILQISAWGEEQSASADTGSTISKGVLKKIYLMTSSQNDNEMAKGIAAEVIYYRRVLSADEISRLKGYLKTKWFGWNAPTMAPTYLANAPTPAPSVAFYTTRGLVLHLNANTYRGGGTWVDSVGGRSFTLHGVTPPAWSANSISFVPGYRQYAHCSTPLPSMGRWSIEILLFYDGFTSGGNPCIVSEYYTGGNGQINFVLGFQNPPLLTYLNGGWRNTATFDLPVNQWSHIVATFDGTFGNVWVNNRNVVVNNNIAGVSQSNNQGIRLMRRWDNDDYWGGNVGVMRIYNVALTAAEINTNFFAPDVAKFGLASKTPTSAPTFALAAPTPAPSVAPSNSPSYTTRGLVLSLDAAKYSGSGDWIDSVTGRVFQLYNGPTWSATVGGGSFTFDAGSSQYAQCNKALPAMSQWTIEVWHYFTNSQQGDGSCIVTDVYNGYFGYYLGQWGTGILTAGHHDGGARRTGTAAMTVGAWNHIVATFDQSNGVGQIYINGVLRVSNYIGGAPRTNGIGIRLMRRWDLTCCAEHWGGKLSVVKFYNVVITASEVNTNYYTDAVRFGLMQSAPPTRIPTPGPTYLPNLPTPGPTSGPVTRGLVLALDAKTYSYSVGYWIDSVAGRAFTLYGGPTLSSAGGGSLIFDAAAGQYAQTLSALPSMATWTVEVWFKWSGLASGSNPCIVADLWNTGTNYCLGSYGDPGIVRSISYTPSTNWLVSSGTSIPTAVWLHIVATYDGTTSKVYVNNVLKVTSSLAGASRSDNKGINLMRRYDQNADQWGGSLAIVRIYNLGLTADDVANNWFADGVRFRRFAAPTLAPTHLPGLPTPMPSQGRVTRGLVLALDAATFVSGATTWVDSVGGLSFTLYNSPVWSSAGGGSLAFVPASSQYAQSPPLPTLSAWTIEVWHLPSGLYTGGEPCLVSDMYNGDINFALGSPAGSPPSFKMGYYRGGWKITPGITLTTGVWQHIVASFDGTTGNLYVNNVLKATANMAGTPVSGNTGIRLFRRWDSAEYWGGSLALVRMYSVGLTAAEVTNNWQVDRERFGYSAAPTAAPTTPVPTYVPLVPTPAPTASPTRLTVRGLVLFLDAATYSGSGNWVDSVSGISFVPYMSPTYSSSEGGGSFSFRSASNQYMKSAASLPSMSSWSVEVWHFYTGLSLFSNPHIVAESYFQGPSGWAMNFVLGQPNGGQPVSTGYSYPNGGGQQVSGNVVLTANKWYHIVGQYNFPTCTFKVYVNGVLGATTSLNGCSGMVAPVSSTGGIWLMHRGDDNAYWDGSLSIVRIYNVALTAAEVNINFLADSPRFGFIPSPTPTSAPSAPTPPPSPAPTKLPAVTRGLVLALDAATYTYGPWVDSVGSRAFTLYNSPVWSSAGGGSLAFVPASSQYAQSPPLPTLSAWTIEVWHLPSGLYTGGEPSLVSDVHDGNINFVLGSPAGSPPSFKMGYHSNGWKITPGITLTTGVWQHIVASFDGTTGNLYVNNVLKATANMAGTPVSGNVGIRLMRRWDLGDYWGGSLALVRIYNVGLTPAEVSSSWFNDGVRFGVTPTLAPTYLPGLPTPMPSAPPSAAPSVLERTTRGLVLALDAATYTYGPWVDSVGERSFVLYKSPVWSSAGGGSIAFVPASAQYAQTNEFLPSMSTWTVEVWHLPSGVVAGGSASIVADMNNGNMNFVLGSSANDAPLLEMAWYSNGWRQTTGITLTTGVWQHIVASFDGTTGNLYVNNVLKATANMAGTPASGNIGLRLMRRWDAGDYWGGSLAKVNIYNVALTPAEVKNNWQVDYLRFGYTSSPTAEPTATPTLVPTYLPGFPTPRPSPAPTTPSAAPTPVPSRAPVVTRGLVLALDSATFVSGATTWVDSVGSRTFTLYNSPVWSSAGGGSLAFVPASLQYAQSPSLPTLSAWTIEVWHLPSGLYAGNEPCIVTDIFTGQSNFALGSPAGSPPSFKMGYYRDPGWKITTGITLTTGVWQHIVASFDGTTGNLYVNNVLKATANMAGTPTPGNSGIRLMRSWNTNDYWGGSLALVRIYSVGLTPAEVNTNWLFDSATRFGL